MCIMANLTTTQESQPGVSRPTTKARPTSDQLFGLDGLRSGLAGNSDKIQNFPGYLVQSKLTMIVIYRSPGTGIIL